MILSRDKSVKLAHLYSRVDWLDRYSASVGLRLNEAPTQAGRMQLRAHDLELVLAHTNSEHDAHRATAEQTAQEAQQQIAVLRGNVEDLTARVAQLEEVHEPQAVSLTEKETLIEGQRNALLTAETTLTAAKAGIEEGRKCIAGKCRD